MANRVRLTTDQKMTALALLARGETLAYVANYLKKEYDIIVSERAISEYRRVHAKTIEKMKATMIEAQAIDADALLRRSRKLLNRKMDKAERDLTELEALDEKYREGEIEIAEYRRKRKGLVELSVAELTNISKSMYEQTKTAPLPNSPGELPAHTEARSAGVPSPQLEQLLAAVASGNTVELQRLVFNPAAAHASPVTV